MFSVTKRLTIGIAFVASFMFAGAAVAQDATPAGPSEGYPIAIHQGTCEDLTAQPNHELGDAVTHGSNNEDAETVGTTEAIPVVMGTSSTVSATIGDLADEGNAIAVHASAEDYDTILACGNVAGINDDGTLVIALNSSEDSTVVGVAILDEDSGGFLGLGDDEVQATVYLFDTEEDGAAATPEA